MLYRPYRSYTIMIALRDGSESGATLDTFIDRTMRITEETVARIIKASNVPDAVVLVARAIKER